MRWTLILFAAFLFCGCSKPSQKSIATESSEDDAVFVVYEGELADEYFGLPLAYPFGLASDFTGNVYLSDAGNDRIVKLSKSYKPLKQIGGYGTVEGSMHFPTYLQVDNGLNIRFSDEKNRRIPLMNSNLQYVDEISFGDEDNPQRFGYPSGLAVSSVGEVWVADRDNNQIVVYNNVGNFSHILGDFGYAGGEVKSPEKIFMDALGNYVVCDAGNKRLVLYDSYGSYQSDIRSSHFEYPVSVTIYKSYFIVLDGVSSSIIVLNSKGQFIKSIESKLPGDDKQLANPSDILLLEDGKILITDTGNNRVIICSIIIDD